MFSFYGQRPLLLALAFLTLAGGSLSLLKPSAAHARGESAWVLPRNSWYVESRAGYGFSNRDQQQAFLFDSHIEMGVIEAATLVLDIPAAMRRQLASGSSDTVLVNNGFTDLFVGSRIRLLEEPFALSINGGLKVPMAYDVSFSPSLGEGQLDAQLGLSAGYDFYPLEAYVQGGLGYRLRSAFDSKHVRVSEALRRSQTLTKPADEILFSLESGVWLTDRVFASVNLWGEMAIRQTNALLQEQIYLNPLLAYRVNPALDVSLQGDIPLFNRERQSLLGVMLGVHLRFGEPLARGKGLRGAVSEFARYEK
jgi:hypothetical protein